MRNAVASVLVMGILLVGCKSSPRGGGSTVMAEAQKLEHEVVASMSSLMSKEGFRHAAAVMLLVLIGAGVWSAMRSRRSGQAPS